MPREHKLETLQVFWRPCLGDAMVDAEWWVSVGDGARGIYIAAGIGLPATLPIKEPNVQLGTKTTSSGLLTSKC